MIYINYKVIYFDLAATSDSSPHSPFPNGYSMMSPYLPPNTSSYLDSSSEGVCGSISGVNGGSGPPGSHHSNHPPPPHMVSQCYDRHRFIYIHSQYESVSFVFGYNFKKRY